MALLRQFISSDRSAQLSSFDPRWRFKLSLHAASILFSFISIVIFASAIPKWNANFFHNTGPLRWDWTDAISLGPLTFGLLFSILNIVHFFSRQRPLPPKICIGSLALTLLALTPALFLAGHGSLFRHWKAAAVRNQNGVLVCNMLNLFSRQCEPILYSIGELQIGAIAMGSLVWVSLFALLLISIFETRAESVTKPRLPRRLTMSISNMEKGYRKNRDGEGRHSRSRSHRQRGTERHYRGSKVEEDGDTVPIVREPPAAHPSRGSSRSS